MNPENRQQIIKFFLKKGYQLDRGAMGILEGNVGKIGDIMTAIKSSMGSTTTITGEDLKKAMGRKRPKIDILFEAGMVKGRTISTTDMLKKMQQSYEILRRTIESRSGLDNLTLISKRGQLQTFSIIAAVDSIDREKQKLFAEDTTGTLSAYVENPKDLDDLAQDDIVGIKCRVVGDEIRAENIIFPDINIKKNVEKTQDEINCYFVWIPNHTESVAHSMYERAVKDAGEQDVFVLLCEGFTKEAAKPLLEQMQTHTMLLIAAEQRPDTKALKPPLVFQVENTRVCITSYTSSDGESEIKKMLKKRRIFTSLDATTQFLKWEPALLSEPDIIVGLGEGEEKITNYKGITMLCMDKGDEPSIWKINLKTRENIKVVMP